MTEDTPSTQSVRVYSYACKILYDHDAAVVENQLALAHRYRHKLTEILLQERTDYREIVSRALGADIAALEEQLDSLNDTIQCLTTDINRAKQVNQTRKPEPTLAQALKDARAQRKICYSQIKAAKQTAQADPSISAKIADSKEVIADTIRTERKTYSQKYGLYWPNYLEAERAANKSRFSKYDPKFRRHLLRYQYGLRSRLLRARREAYRHFVFALRSAYNICGIEQFDLRNLKRNDFSQDEPPLDIVKWNSNAAAVSLLTRMLKEKMPVVQLDPKDSTHLCSGRRLMLFFWNVADGATPKPTSFRK